MGARMRIGTESPRAALMLATLLLLLPASAPSLAEDVSATRGGTRDVNEGTDSIQAAIDQAIDGDVIVVGPGIYRERIDLLGKAITVRSEAGAEFTLIDGRSRRADEPGGSTIVMISGEGPRTKLEGFSIAGGAGTIAGAEGSSITRGGGLLLLGASPIIRECLVLNNTAARGGAVYTEGGTPVFLDCWFYLNESSGGGATIDCVRSRPRMLACGFHEDGIQWENTGSISVRSDCGPGGACCLRDACIIATRTACDDAGGRWEDEDVPCVEGTCPLSCPEDVNGDRRVNMTDALRVLDAWGMCD